MKISKTLVLSSILSLLVISPNMANANDDIMEYFNDLPRVTPIDNSPRTMSTFSAPAEETKTGVSEMLLELEPSDITVSFADNDELDKLELDLSKNQTKFFTELNSTITVDDPRGSDSKWNLAVTATPFYNENSPSEGLAQSSISLVGRYVDRIGTETTSLINEPDFQQNITNQKVYITTGGEGGKYEHRFEGIEINLVPKEINFNSNQSTTNLTASIVWTLTTDLN